MIINNVTVTIVFRILDIRSASTYDFYLKNHILLGGPFAYCLTHCEIGSGS